MFREAVVRAISAREGMLVVGQTEFGREAIEFVRRNPPTVCVLDLGLPDLAGAKVLETLMAEHPETRVLVLSGECDSEVVYAMIEAGASGFELKTAGAGEIVDAVEAVAQGRTVLPAEVHQGLASAIRARRTDTAPPLTPRELEILQSVAMGHSAGEIAKELNLAESTIKTHLTRIYDKIGVSERAAAVAEGIRHGWID
ncbi:MAG: response regulator transcription factor [Thermoleophilaceae bacterium]|nr:response regulator transcription factor [Thermoleophilaceae bacterium]